MIKNCPFCGSKSCKVISIRFKYGRDEYFRVKCFKCGAMGSSFVSFYSNLRNILQKAQAIKAWNTRVSLPNDPGFEGEQDDSR